MERTKAYVDPNVAFPLKDNFSVGTIHGANVPKAAPIPQVQAAATPAYPFTAATQGAQGEIIEILDNDAEDDVSVLTTKTQDEMVVLLVKARRQLHTSTSCWVASGCGSTPVSIPVVMSSPSVVGR